MASAQTRPRVTNNSVASLDEQSVVLAAVFKEKEKEKRKLAKIKKRSKPAETVTRATLHKSPADDDLSMQEDSMNDSQDLTWAQARMQVHNAELEVGNFPSPNSSQLDMEDYSSHMDDFIQDGGERPADHSVSDGEDEVLPEEVIPKIVSHDNKEKSREVAVLPEITSQGKGAELLKEQLTQVKESDKLAPKISEPVAACIDKYLRESWYNSDMEKVSKLYPRIENVKGLKVPKLDVEVFQLLEQTVRNTDQSFQTVQKAMIASLCAVAPVLDLAIQRGDTDEHLDSLTKNLMHSIQLMSFATNGIATRRKDILKPCLAPVYAKVLTKGHDTTPEWLFGGDLLTTTKKCEAAKRIGEKVLKSKNQEPQRRDKQQSKRFKGPQQFGQGQLRGYNPHGQQNQRFQAQQGFNPQFQFPTPQQQYQQFQQYPQNQGYQQQQGFQKQRFNNQNSFVQQGKKNNSFPK